jgi:hypothetical protein
MQRRKLLIGIGSLAAGGAATMGTGAFAVQARDRQALGTITGDAAAYLSLIPTEYSSINNDGKIEVNLERLNSDSVTEIDDLFRVENTGDGPVRVRIINIASPGDISINEIFVSSGTNQANDLRGPNSQGARLDSGQTLGVGAEIEVGDIPKGQSNDVTFDVDANAES